MPLDVPPDTFRVFALKPGTSDLDIAAAAPTGKRLVPRVKIAARLVVFETEAGVERVDFAVGKEEGQSKGPGISQVL